MESRIQTSITRWRLVRHPEGTAGEFSWRCSFFPDLNSTAWFLIVRAWLSHFMFRFSNALPQKPDHALKSPPRT